MTKTELHKSLASIVGEANLLTGRGTVAEYARDSFHSYRAYKLSQPKSPVAVVRPSSAQQIADIMRWAKLG